MAKLSSVEMNVLSNPPSPQAEPAAFSERPWVGRSGYNPSSVIAPEDKLWLLRLRNVVSVFKRGRQPVGDHSPSSTAGVSANTQSVSVLHFQRQHSWPVAEGPHPIYVWTILVSAGLQSGNIGVEKGKMCQRQLSLALWVQPLCLEKGT